MAGLFHPTPRIRKQTATRQPNRRKCFFEPLEDRRLLTSTPGLPWLELTEFTDPSDLDPGDQAGNVTAISGDTIVVSSAFDDDKGVDAGAAYVYVRDDAGTPSNPRDDAWLKQAKLFGDDTTTLDEFGQWVDIQGDTIVVGAPQKDNGKPGAAYVFRRSGTTWTQAAKLTASNGAINDNFGGRVAIDGDTIIVRARQSNNEEDVFGSVYVFVEPVAGWSGNLTESAKLNASLDYEELRFGRYIDIQGDTVLVGAVQSGIGAGAAYVFQRDDKGTPSDSSDDTWTETAILQASDGQDGDSFGNVVALDGDRAVITAHQADPLGVVDAGAAYIFERQQDGTWAGVSKVFASDGEVNDLFGRGADLEGDTLVVGGARTSLGIAPNTGSVYFFERQDDGTWLEQGEATASDVKSTDDCGGCIRNHFGITRIELQGDTLVAGDRQQDSKSGAAFVFLKGDSSIVASDRFEFGSFSDGLGQWSDDNGWTAAGDASIRTDNDPRSGLYHARLRRNSGDLRRVVDVSNLTDVRLRFWSKLNSFESSDKARVRVSGDGSSWTTLTTFVNGQDDNQYHFHELDVPDLGDTLHVRFDAAMNSSKDYWYIDNVEVTGAPAGPPNQAPAITTSPVTTATEDLLYSYDVDASDPDAGDTLTFSLDSAPSGMTIDANTGVIQWTPNNAQVGSNPVTVRAQDTGGLFDTQSFNVSVANTNDAPSITSSPVTTANAESLYSYDVDASDPDVGDTLAFSLDAAPSGMTIHGVSGLIEWTPTSGQVGSNSVTVRVQDLGGLFATQSFSIDVAAVNHAPAITSAPVTSAIEDTLYSYDVDATDSDPGDTLTYSLDVAPSGMTIDSGTGLIQWTPTNSQVGLNSVTVRAADQAGASDTQAFSVTVANTNDAPTITSTPVTDATVDAPYSYDVQATDPDVGDLLTFSLPISPTGMSIDSNTGLIEWTPTAAQAGTRAVTVRVQDSGGLWDEQSFSITVTAAPSTKFYVVDNSVDDMFEYTAAVSLEDNYNLGPGNNSPKGVAADSTGNTIWVIDNDDYVYVYDTDGSLLRSWKALELSRPEGIASDGTDVWIVDRGDDRVHRFIGGATRTTNATSSSSFDLEAGNPRGITTDGTHLWVVDTGTDDVYKYTVNGAFLGNWALDSRNSVPRGITIDPSNVDDIWVVDSTDDAIYEYTAAASRTSGSQAASDVYNLAGSNTNPQGIADPPPFGSSDAANVQDEMAMRSLDLTDFLRGTEWTSRALRRSPLQILRAEQDEPIFRTVPPQAHPNSRSAIRQESRAREEVFAALEKVEQEILDDEWLDALLQQGSARTIVRVDA